MIDPKLNELVDTTTKGASRPANAAREESDPGKRGVIPRAGLSINDTVAGDANLSVGSRGVDTSGVRAGAGAGDGGTYVGPGTTGESPAPEVVGGPRGSGTTPLSDGPSSLRATSVSGEGGTEWSSSDVANHAYNIWCERGCPEGTHEEDWHRAERELRERQANRRSSSASA